MTNDGDDPTVGTKGEPAFLDEEAFLPPRPRPPGRGWLAALLMGVSLLGTAAVLPYSISLLRQAKDSAITPAAVPAIVVVSLAIEGAISAAAIAVGLALGARTGLGPRLLDGLDGPPEGGPALGPARDWLRALRAMALAATIGVVLGGVVIATSYAVRPWMPASATSIEAPSAGQAWLASIGAGVREEVWLRLGVMTLLAGATLAITRREPGDPASIWTGNVLAALAFGAIHLPQAAMLIGLNAAVVTFVLVGNGLPGIAFGWLFWRKGLIAAMVAHFMLDVILKVVLPAVTS